MYPSGRFSRQPLLNSLEYRAIRAYRGCISACSRIVPSLPCRFASANKCSSIQIMNFRPARFLACPRAVICELLWSKNPGHLRSNSAATCCGNAFPRFAADSSQREKVLHSTYFSTSPVRAASLGPRREWYFCAMRSHSLKPGYDEGGFRSHFSSQRSQYAHVLWERRLRTP